MEMKGAGRIAFLLALVCALAAGEGSHKSSPEPSASASISKSISINEELGTIVPINSTRPCHSLRFAAGSRQLHNALKGVKLAVVAIMPPNGAHDSEEFVNRTAEAVRMVEQHFRLGKVRFVLSDPQAHMGVFSPQESLIRTINAHLAKQIKPSDINSDSLRDDHHAFQMELHDEAHALNRKMAESGQIVDRATTPRPFMDRVQSYAFPAYVVTANGEPMEVWDGRTTSPGDVASRIASIANGKLRALNSLQVASHALRSPIRSTVILRHTSKASQPLRVALAPFATVIGGDGEFFNSKVPRGSFLVLTRKDLLQNLPLPVAVKMRSLDDFFPEEAVNRLRSEDFVVVEVDSLEGGKDSYTHTKALRRHSRSVSKSRSRSKSLSAEGNEEEGKRVLSETDLVPPTINADVSVGMECLKVISRLVVPPIADFQLSRMQAIYARAPCIVFAFHGYNLYHHAGSDLTPELLRKCTFLTSNTGDQKIVASFGFSLQESGDEGKLLLGVHYNHGKYPLMIDMDLMPPQEPEDDAVDSEADDTIESIGDGTPAVTGGSQPQSEDAEDDDDDLYESRKAPRKAQSSKPKRKRAQAVTEAEQSPEGAPIRYVSRYNVKAVAHRLVPFIKSVLNGKAQLYEKTQQFEGEHSDPSTSMVGEYFYDFLDTDDIHTRLLSDYSRDSFIVVFPPKCGADGCEEELRLASTVVGNLDKYRESDAFRNLAVGFYNLSSNALHKHLDPSLATAEGVKLVFLERMKKFHFFMHNHARYSSARFKGGLAFEGKSEDGVIESEVLDLTGASTADVFSFIKKHSQGAEHFIEGDGKNLDEIEYDEL